MVSEPAVPDAAHARPSTEAVGLTREAVVDAAIRIVETDGIRALSMRKLAAALGVKPASIYWHVGNRAQLVDAIDDRLAQEFQVVLPETGTPREQLRAVSHALRRTLLARLTVTDLLRHEERGVAVMVAPRNAMLRAFRASGLAEPDALDATRAFLFHVAGFVLAERMSASAVEALRAGRAAVPGLDVEGDDPRRALESWDPDHLFDFSIEKFLDALLRD